MLSSENYSCKGSIMLESACMKCLRCRKELAEMAKWAYKYRDEIEQKQNNKNEKITIENVREELFKNEHFFESSHGEIKNININIAGRGYAIDQSGCLTKNQLIQEQARRDLQNVSSYLNNGEYRGFIFNDNNWYFFWDNLNKNLKHHKYFKFQRSDVYFHSENDLETAFEILGEKRIKEALGVFR